MENLPGTKISPEQKKSNKRNAVPSPRGWRHPRTGELLKKQKLTQKRQRKMEIEKNG